MTKYTSSRESRGAVRDVLALGVLVWSLSGCTSSDLHPLLLAGPDAGPGIDAALSATRDAGGGVDGRTDGSVSSPDAANRDADAADGSPGTTDRCAQDWAFLAAHRTCAVDADCVIVGACSGGFGFFAVEQSAKTAAQALSDHTLCPAYDGPIYHAVCEQSLCRARATGASCGGARPSDGGTPGCPANGELYRTDCAGSADAAQPAVCATRCSGMSDASCGPGARCAQVSVSEASGAYGAGCGMTYPVWLCQPLATDAGTH